MAIARIYRYPAHTLSGTSNLKFGWVVFAVYPGITYKAQCIRRHGMMIQHTYKLHLLVVL